MLTLGFEASTLGFARCLEVSYPGLLSAVACCKICVRLRSAASCRLPTFSHGVVGLGLGRAARSSCAAVVEALIAEMLATLVCCGKKLTVSELRLAWLLVT